MASTIFSFTFVVRYFRLAPPHFYIEQMLHLSMRTIPRPQHSLVHFWFMGSDHFKLE